MTKDNWIKAKPQAPIPAWEGLTFIELLQLKQMCSTVPEDKDYVEKLTNYINEVAKYEQTKR